jgi:hypothetical protein
VSANSRPDTRRFSPVSTCPERPTRRTRFTAYPTPKRTSAIDPVDSTRSVVTAVSVWNGVRDA